MATLVDQAVVGLANGADGIENADATMGVATDTLAADQGGARDAAETLRRNGAISVADGLAEEAILDIAANAYLLCHTREVAQIVELVA